MHKILILAFWLLVNALNAQTTIKITDQNNKALPEVFIYQNDSLLGVTNQAGEFQLKETEVPIALIKAGYEDTVVNLSSLKNYIIALKKIEAVDLGELVIKTTYKQSIEDLFKRVTDSLNHLSGYKPRFRNYYLYNLSKVNQDTVIYVDGRLFVDKNALGLFLDLQSKPQINYKRLIIMDSLGRKLRHFYIQRDNEKVSFDESRYSTPHFKASFNHNRKLRDVLNNPGKYQLETTKHKNMLIVNYYPKKAKAFTYSGILIINLEDYTLNYFKSKLVNHKKNIHKVGYSGQVPIRDYFVLNDDYEVIFKKNPEDNLSHTLTENFNYTSSCKTDNEELLFTNIYIKKPTDVFKEAPKNKVLYMYLYEHLKGIPIE